MNIQIFGKNKCFDTKKAERYFKERRVKYQYVDLLRYGLSGKEFDAVLRGVGGIDNLIDWNSKSESITLMKYMKRIKANPIRLLDPAPSSAGRMRKINAPQTVSVACNIQRSAPSRFL